MQQQAKIITRFFFIFLVLALLVNTSSASAVINVEIYCQSSINLGEFDQINIIVSETSGKTNAADVRVALLFEGVTGKEIKIEPGSGVIGQLDDLYGVEYNVGEIQKGTSKTIVVPVTYSENMNAGSLNMGALVSYHYSELFGMKTAGPYYVTKERSILIKDPYGKVSIISDPAGARIYMNDIYRGVTPLNVEKVIPGDYKIRLEKEGYIGGESGRTVYAGKTASLEATLPEAAQEVSLKSNPSGADVYINGNYKGQTPLNTKLPFGKYSIEYKKDGYKSKTTSATIDGNGNGLGTQTITLEKVDSPAQSTATSISSSGQSATVEYSVSSPSSSSGSSYQSSSSNSNSNQSPGLSIVAIVILIGLACITIRRNCPRQK